MNGSQSDNLRLTDFVDLATLQEIQDSFAAVADVKAVITDADGNLLTQPTPTKSFLSRQKALESAANALSADAGGPQREGAVYVAPIIVSEQRVGMIRMSASASAGVDEAKLAQLAEKFGIEPRQVRNLVQQWVRSKKTRPAAIQFLFLLANAIAKLCYQEHQLRLRVAELSAVSKVAVMLSDARDLQRVLDRTAQVVCELTDTKSSSIRLIDEDNDELIIKAVHNLSRQYLNKGPIRLSKAAIDHEALGPTGYSYVADMAADPRTQYPEESRRERVVSMLSVGMRIGGRPIGVLRVYTEKEQEFSRLQIDLLKAVAAQAAVAIENARLHDEALAAEAMERQIGLAAEVQQRMIPQAPPKWRGVDLASAYVPMYSLGGDFYDFIPLPGDNLGVAIADVSGKGVPASLIMASVRAFLRAQVDNVYYLYEVMRRMNLMLCRDTKPSEFVTLLYGVIDAGNMRFTYSNAGHPPGLILRNGEVLELRADNMILGVNCDEMYEQSVIDLKKSDILLLYTDGLADAVNFDGERFGRLRIIEALKESGATADIIAQNILWRFRKFVGLGKPVDDVTLLVVRIE